MSRQSQARKKRHAYTRESAVPRYGPQERALRHAIDRASVFASEKRHENDLSKLQDTAVRVTIPAIVSNLSVLDRRHSNAIKFHGEMDEPAFRANESDAVLWMLWLDVIRDVFAIPTAEGRRR
ncbi:hypothetical protein [Sphingobium xenophagum]|uniref:hypothetical protein n=1 Tax=Sphingobium xenophagum TaxID=121428 RepID=UPI00036D481C|nr:hypothetical protein [Sphingobium xenophagum]